MDWERKYQTGDTPWDHGEAAPPLLEALAELPRAVWGEGEVLGPGCGTGHDVRALTAAGLNAVGLDFAPSAIARAKLCPAAGTERYLVGDLFDSAWRSGLRCTAVWEHTCFCAMPPSERPRYRAAVAELLVPGACLVGVFYLYPEPRDDGLPGPPFGIGEGELNEFFAPDFTLERSWVPRQAYPSRAGRERLAVFRRKQPDADVAR
jgi:methyl halide transferase